MTLEIEESSVWATFENDAGERVTLQGEIVLNEAEGHMYWVKCRAGDEDVQEYKALYKFVDGKLVICGDADRPGEFDERTIVFRKE